MDSGRDSNIIAFPQPPGAKGAFQLRVELLLMPQPVWRRLLVPARMNFWELHIALQDVMGWEGYHLHQFMVDEPRSGRRRRFGIPDDSGFHGVHEILPGWEHAIARYLTVDGLPVLYTYDFGDDWQHEVVLEAVVDESEAGTLPQCLAGEGACPPEDSGGPAMCEALMREGGAAAFDPRSVVFDNPRLRWQSAFGRDWPNA